ncbi:MULTISPECIES: helix-turn-helix domain-containing protein [Enterococcus]|uniref:helix-turn-helix domain-containing protein n=2 Tax=Enterococcus TaxID=1350 RepID=UPI0035623A1C|nr:helix-turn-helix transcriptional regulator [Enterococcus faecium]
MIGVGKSKVRKWENGIIENMECDKIMKLSNALSISPLAILGIEEPNQESDLKSNYQVILCNNFKKYRLKRNLTVEQLVEQLNSRYSDSQLFTIDQIENYENGIMEPSLSIAKYLADFYVI